MAKSLSPPPSDLTRLSETNNGVFPVSRVHEVIDGRMERSIHGTRDMPVWGDRYLQEMTSKESREYRVEGMERSDCPSAYLGVGRIHLNIAACDAQESLNLFMKS